MSMFGIKTNQGNIASMGMFEMHLGNNGLSMNLGTGGQDVSLGTLAAVARGAGVLEKNAQIGRYTNDPVGQVLMRYQFGYGDKAAQEQADRFLAGIDMLQLGTGGSANAQTIMKNGKRQVLLNIAGATSVADLAIVLGHEAQRDGIVGTTEEQTQETQAAVTSHVLMAKRMQEAGVPISSAMEGEILTYMTGGISALQNMAKQVYDSSADYMLLRKDGTVEGDGSADWHWEADQRGTDSDGKPIYKSIIKANGASIEISLVTGVGGSIKAREILASKGVELTGTESDAQLGTLMEENLKKADGTYDLDYSQLAFDKDYKAIADSYERNKPFLDKHLSDSFQGPANLLTKANGGDTVVNKLEYFSLLYDPLKQALSSNFGYIGDPGDYFTEDKFTSVKIPGQVGSQSVYVNNVFANDLKAGLDRANLIGAQIPSITSITGDKGGGLNIRFQNRGYNDNLVLSDHALGLAVDFDPYFNGQFTLDKNTPKTSKDYLRQYVENQSGMSVKDANGAVDQAKLAILERGFPVYLDSRLKEVNQQIELLSAHAPGKNAIFDSSIVSNGLVPVETLFMTPAQQAAQLVQLTKEQTTIMKAKWQNYPSPSFAMQNSFVAAMSNYMTWGGNWWGAQDYMHFQWRNIKK